MQNSLITSTSQTSNQLVEVGKIKREHITSLEQVVNAKIPTISVIRSNEKARYGLLSLIAAETSRYLHLFDMEAGQIKVMAETFAVDVFDKMDNWNEMTVIMMFKTIRQNPYWKMEIEGKDVFPFQVFGNKLTISKLNEMALAYDIFVGEERLKIRQKEQSDRDKPMTLTDAQILEKYLISMEKGQQDKDTKMTTEEKVRRAIETRDWTRENEAKLKELKAKIDIGELTEEEALKQYDEYLLRK